MARARAGPAPVSPVPSAPDGSLVATPTAVECRRERFPVPEPSPASIAPLAPERYRIQLTVSRETHDKFRRAQALLRHAVPSGDAAEIFDRAVTLLVDRLERQRFAQAERPRATTQGAAGASRHIPAAVRRAVWRRDGGCCAFVGTEGRCGERAFLELHHVEPYAVGGAATVENIELRCRAHNAYEARLFFGPDVVREGEASWGDSFRNKLLNPVDSNSHRTRDYGRLIVPEPRLESLRSPGGPVRWLDIEQDVRYATRTLRRSPGFATVAVLTLALGIGATTAIYSVVDTILLQPLPFAGADGLVQITENVPLPGRPPFQRAVTYQEFLEWRNRSTTLADAFAVSMGENVVRTREGMARLWGATLSANTFTVLGARAELGRPLVAGDATNPNVVVHSFDTWRRLFNSDPAAVGATIEFIADFNASLTPELVPPRLVTIVGVMPAAFGLPSGPMDFYTPLVVDGSKRSPRVTLFGRLPPGVSLTAALEEANVIGSAIVPPPPANAPALNVPRFEVRGIKERMVQDLRPALRVLLGAVAAVSASCAPMSRTCCWRAERRGSARSPYGWRSAPAVHGSCNRSWRSAECSRQRAVPSAQRWGLPASRS